MNQLEEALTHHRSGQLEKAAAVYRQIIQSEPANANALHLYGAALHQAGKSAEAVEYFSRAIKLAPNSADIHANFADVWRQLGRLDRAIDCYNNATRINPNDVEVHFLTGTACTALFRHTDAVKSFQRVLELKPDHLKAHINLASALNFIGRLEDGLRHGLRAIELGAKGYEAHFNTGFNLARMNRIDEAIPYFEEVLRRKPNSHLAHYEMGIAHLTQGKLETGWAEYEWRLDHPQFPKPREFDRPRWDGSDPSGKTILLYADQGMGDTIQWLRYVPLLECRGATVIVECQKSLVTFVRSLFPRLLVFAKGETLPPFDLHVQVTSLPYFFKTTLATIPTGMISFVPDDRRAAHFRQLVRSHGGPCNIGLVWAGNPKHPNDSNRSLSLDILAPLGRIEGMSFFSLQKGHAAMQIKQPPAGMRICDMNGETNDMLDTACLIAQLDLIISVDTSCAHLAGTIGKPVWNLIPFTPDFRWMLQREDSPWYPTMRLFRQPRIGDWTNVIERVADELAKKIPAQRVAA